MPKRNNLKEIDINDEKNDDQVKFYMCEKHGKVTEPSIILEIIGDYCPVCFLEFINKNIKKLKTIR